MWLHSALDAISMAGKLGDQVEHFVDHAEQVVMMMTTIMRVEVQKLRPLKVWRG